MESHRRMARKLSAPCTLTLEQLETRQLMAVNVVAAPNLGDSLTAESALAASNDAQRTHDGSTPISTTVSSLSGLRNVEARSYDGTGNNLANAEWGSTGEQLLREAGAEYGDGISSPGGVDRPSPREISNALAAQSDESMPNDRQLSAFIYVWGQFIDHDMDLTEPPVSGTEAYNIAVPSGDLLFDPTGTGSQVIGLSRSRYDATTGDSSANPRQQVNEITSWIDGSMVYGSDAATAASLRALAGGKMKTTAGNLPPIDAAGNYMAGDVRANENIELTAMHTLWVREHNQWADKLARANPRWTDEQIFQAARAVVIAEIQAITFNEFLPALLGRGAIDAYHGYDPTVNPNIANEFSTAAFRLGHSLINDDVEFFGNDGRAVRDEVELRDAFFNPAMFSETGPDAMLKYLASTQAQELDNQIVDSLRNFLFGQPGQGGFDLASLNIQRGRDHGLADYNSVREAYGLPGVTSFADITSDVGKQQTLAALYGNVDNIDMWVGALAEDHVPGSSVGPLVQAVVSDQFERLRDGDRLWYQNVFSGSLLRQLNRTTLADVVRRNSTTTNLQDNVFFMRAEISGQVFADANGDGQLGRREDGVRGVTLELLNDEGQVVATTKTDSRGRYRFTSFAETGDYQVRLTIPGGMQATTEGVKDVLISRGGVARGGVDFGLRRQSSRLAATARDATLASHRSASIDEALATLDPSTAAQLAQGLATTNAPSDARLLARRR